MMYLIVAWLLILSLGVAWYLYRAERKRPLNEENARQLLEAMNDMNANDVGFLQLTRVDPNSVFVRAPHER